MEQATFAEASFYQHSVGEQGPDCIKKVGAFKQLGQHLLKAVSIGRRQAA